MGQGGGGLGIVVQDNPLGLESNKLLKLSPQL